MKKRKWIRKRLDELEKQKFEIMTTEEELSKRPMHLNPKFSIRSFSSWYWKWCRKSNWYKKETQKFDSKSRAKYDGDLKQKIVILYNALVIAMENGWIPHQLSPKQFRFLLLPSKDAFYGGAAGGGKSEALLTGALMFCHVPGYHAILFRKSLEDHRLSGGLIPRSKEWLLPVLGKKAWKSSRHTWTFPSGATLSFGYLNNIDDHYRYQSSEFHYIGFDEVPQIPRHQFLYLFSRLRKLESQDIPLRMRCAGNPEGRFVEWVKQRYVDERTAISPFVPAKIADNPGLDKEDYLHSLNYLDPITRARLRDGDWTLLDGGRLFQRSWFGFVKDYPRGGRMVRYWDKAATEPGRGKDPDYTVGALCTLVDGILYVIDVVRFRGTPQTNESFIRQTAEMDGLGVDIYMEQEPGSAGVNDIDHYRRHVLLGYSFYGVKSTGSKEIRANPFSSASEAGNVKLVRGSWNEAFLDELILFPDGEHDDQVDAVAGAYQVLSKHPPLGGDGVPSIFG